MGILRPFLDKLTLSLFCLSFILFSFLLSFLQFDLVLECTAL